MIRATDLIAIFQYALDNAWGYILGTAGILWTADKQAATDNEKAQQYGEKWIGHYVADCSGLFKWAFKQLGGNIYHGSNTIWDKYLSAKGKLNSGQRSDGKPLLPGTAVFLLRNGDDRHHLGLYIGNGEVIEAKGTAYGVVKSNINQWDEWGELKDVDYDEQEEETDMEVPFQAVATADSGKTVNLRQGPDKKSVIIAWVPVGDTVTVLDELGEWDKVSYHGKTGYMMAKYLWPVSVDEGEDQTESETVKVPSVTLDTWADVLEEMARDIREKLGRG